MGQSHLAFSSKIGIPGFGWEMDSGTSPQAPGIYRFGTNPEAGIMKRGAMLATTVVLVPESALGLLPSIALSSAQAECNCTGDAPSGEQPSKTDSSMSRLPGSPIPGM